MLGSAHCAGLDARNLYAQLPLTHIWIVYPIYWALLRLRTSAQRSHFSIGSHPATPFTSRSCSSCHCRRRPSSCPQVPGVGVGLQLPRVHLRQQLPFALQHEAEQRQKRLHVDKGLISGVGAVGRAVLPAKAIIGHTWAEILWRIAHLHGVLREVTRPGLEGAWSEASAPSGVRARARRFAHRSNLPRSRA